jgi:hypothetical protein
MLFGNYRFQCRFESSARLPRYKGSTFRGVFGRALKETACTQAGADCAQCAARPRCLYFSVFESDRAPDESQDPNASAALHPFVIEPPDSERTEYREGERFDFGLLLFGRVNRSLAFFVRAIEKMGRIGIGPELNGNRGHFSVEEVESAGRIVYTQAGGFAAEELSDTRLTCAIGAPGGTTLPRVNVCLRTPLRTKFRNRYKAELPFHILVRACLRRMSGLLNRFGEGEPGLDYPALVRRAEQVAILAQDLRWFDWRRFSFRQDQAMLMGGMVGELDYRDVPRDFLPLLEFCQAAHIGKQTTFGLGQIDCRFFDRKG